MATLAELPLNSTVSFDTHAPTVLGTMFKNAKVLAHVDMDTARFWIDPEAMHINVYPFLAGMGVPDDPASYSYVKVKLANGTSTAVGLPWIKGDSIKVFTETSIQITVDGVGPDDRANIIQALAANGYKAAKVELK